MDLKKWKAELGDQYVLLFRAHYEVSKVMEVQENDFVRNVTDYPALNVLMIVSDILISDYSSIFFDYSIMDKCMLHFTYDFDKYEEKRGMYFDIRDYISGADSEDGVIAILRELNIQREFEKTVAFRNMYMNPNIHYIIAGKGPLHDYLLELSKELEVSNNVHLLGYRRDVDELYKTADVYVLPSKREGLNVSLIEAVASGLPCLVSHIMGNVDLINDQGCFVLNDCETLKKLLTKKVENYSKLISCFSFSIVADRMKKIYISVIEE